MALDVQMKKGLLEICVLKALSDGESYGYKIIKDVSAYIDISESTLYPILKRLESDGHLVCTTAAHNGRLRKYYGITASGRNRIPGIFGGVEGSYGGLPLHQRGYGG